MDHVRLRLLEHYAQPVLDPNGETVLLSFVRLWAMLQVGRRHLIRDGIIDTGAALSVFPDKYWHEFRDDIEWLTFPPGTSPDSWWVSASGLSGGQFPCRLGRIEVAVFDALRNRLAPVPVVAKFVDDNHVMQRILLGLNNGILQGRRLVVAPDDSAAWIQEDRRPLVPLDVLVGA